MELVPPVETQQTDKPILLQITAPTKEEVKSPYEELCGHLSRPNSNSFTHDRKKIYTF